MFQARSEQNQLQAHSETKQKYEPQINSCSSICKRKC